MYTSVPKIMTRFDTVFIGGTGRCGTNILKDLLAESDNYFALPFETRFTIDPDGLVHSYLQLTTAWSPFVVRPVIERMERFLTALSSRDSTYESGYRDWELSNSISGYEQIINRLFDDLRTFDYSARWPMSGGNEVMVPYVSQTGISKHFESALLSIHTSIRTHNNTNVYVEDNTYNGLYAPTLLELSGEKSMFVHILRDPRDVVCSFREQRWTPNSLEQCVELYRGLITKNLQGYKRCPQSRRYSLRLEDLICDRAEELSKLTSFIGFDLENSRSEIELSSRSVGRWQREFNEAEANYVGSALKSIINELGYE